MNCHNCVKEIVSAGIYCQFCRAKQNRTPEKAYDEAVPNKGVLLYTELPEKRARKRITNAKVLKIAALTIAVAVVFGGLILLVINLLPGSQKQLSAAELLDLGEKYLLDLNYEQALVQFLLVIEIEPKIPRGYTGAAEANIGMGDKDSAIDILQQGLTALPDNAEITAMLDELTKPIEPEEPAVSEDIFDFNAMYEAFYETVVHNPELAYTWNGNPTVLSLTGGGLLDFDSDDIPELVLHYSGDPYINVVVIYTFKNRQAVELFNYTLEDGGNYIFAGVLEQDGRGAIQDYIRLSPIGDGSSDMATAGGLTEEYYVVENGTLVSKLGYYWANYVINGKITHQVWETFRNGEIIGSGTAKPGVSIPEIGVILLEAETTYGDAWRPMSIDELLRTLSS